MKYYVKSYAKINLSLNVYKSKGINSLHPIESLFQEISLYDEIEITPIKTTTVDYTITYSGFTIPTNSKNIIGKIIETLAPNLNHSYQIHINKKIPLGSGMGGASSNAAIILKAINTIEKKEYILGNIDHTWSVFKEIKEEEIEKTGTQLGELLKQN